MNHPTHVKKKLKQIIFEYVRCQGQYYTNMVMGDKSGTEGKNPMISRGFGGPNASLTTPFVQHL